MCHRHNVGAKSCVVLDCAQVALLKRPAFVRTCQHSQWQNRQARDKLQHRKPTSRCNLSWSRNVLCAMRTARSRLSCSATLAKNAVSRAWSSGANAAITLKAELCHTGAARQPGAGQKRECRHRPARCSWDETHANTHRRTCVVIGARDPASRQRHRRRYDVSSNGSSNWHNSRRHVRQSLHTRPPRSP